MKKKLNLDGSIELDGTPEELSEYDKKSKNSSDKIESKTKSKKNLLNG